MFVKNGCEWLVEETCHVATSNGHLECLKYVHENGCPINIKDLNKFKK